MYKKGSLTMSDLSEASGGLPVVKRILSLLQTTSVRIEFVSDTDSSGSKLLQGPCIRKCWIEEVCFNRGIALFAFHALAMTSSNDVSTMLSSLKVEHSSKLEAEIKGAEIEGVAANGRP